MKLPAWTFGYLLEETAIRHPQVLTAREISNRLGISYNAARLLKQRVQLFAMDQMPAIKELIREELKKKFRGFDLPPESKNVDLRESRKIAPRLGSIPQVDTLVLFSASQRANKGRKRYKHSGQTSSIYLSDRLGGKQIGTMTHIFSWKGGPLLLDSIPDQKASTIGPLIDEYLPKHVPLFSDEGFRFLAHTNRNHRMISHSSRSPEKRYQFARNRWCRNGIHSQTAEGNARLVKIAFSAYCWTSPKYSRMYLEEFAFFKSLRYYGLERVGERSARMRERSEGSAAGRGRDAGKRRDTGRGIDGGRYRRREGGGSAGSSPGTRCVDSNLQICPDAGPWIANRIKAALYNEPETNSRLRLMESKTANTASLRTFANDRKIKLEIERYVQFWKANPAEHRKRSERKYASLATDLWNLIRTSKEGVFDTDSIELPRQMLRVIRVWKNLGIAHVLDRTDRNAQFTGQRFFLRHRIRELPSILYSIGVEERKMKEKRP